MDLIGKVFCNKNTMVYIEGVKRSTPDIEGTLYNCISLEKYAFAYSTGCFVNLEKNIIINYPTEVNTNIIFKVKSMLHMNYVACSNIANNIKVVKSSRHIIRTTSGLLLWGAYGLGEYITKKDYNKIFHRVKRLKKDIDKLWADVV